MHQQHKFFGRERVKSLGVHALSSFLCYTLRTGYPYLLTAQNEGCCVFPCGCFSTFTSQTVEKYTYAAGAAQSNALSLDRLFFLLWLYHYYYYYWSLLYSAILRSRADSLHLHVILHEWIVFIARFFLISTEVVYLQRCYGWCHKKLLPSQRVLCTPYNHAPCHFMQSHIRKAYACLAVTCHLRFWHNDRGLLRATACTSTAPSKDPHWPENRKWANVLVCRFRMVVVLIFMQHGYFFHSLFTNDQQNQKEKEKRLACDTIYLLCVCMWNLSEKKAYFRFYAFIMNNRVLLYFSTAPTSLWCHKTDC